MSRYSLITQVLWFLGKEKMFLDMLGQVLILCLLFRLQDGLIILIRCAN